MSTRGLHEGHKVRRHAVRAPVVRPEFPGTVHRPQPAVTARATAKHEAKREIKQGTAMARQSVAQAVADGPEHPEKPEKPGSAIDHAVHDPLHAVATTAKKHASHQEKTRRSVLRRQKRSRAERVRRRRLFRLRHAAQLLVIIGCMGWGIYHVVNGALTVADTPSTGADIVAQDGQMLDDQYPGLPAAVAAAVKSIVATQRITGSDGTVQNGIAGSGVVINERQILTAGHNVEDGGGLACSKTRVLASGMLARASASQETVTYASVEYGQDDDIAVLEVLPSANFKVLPDAKLANQVPQAGETVYFVNYQPAADGKSRSPYAKDSSYAEPAVFSATVLGASDKRFAVATGGGKSFGRGVADVLLRKGASGGAIYNGKGELVGLSVASESLAANRSAASILKEYQVNLPVQNYQVAYMQQVDQALVSRLQTGMVSCTGQ